MWSRMSKNNANLEPFHGHKCGHIVNNMHQCLLQNRGIYPLRGINHPSMVKSMINYLSTTYVHLVNNVSGSVWQRYRKPNKGHLDPV